MVDVQRVLVVDGPADTTQVLQAVLEPRGCLVERIASPAASSPRLHAASVLVLHRNEVEADGPSPDVPQVIIGRITPPATPSQGRRYVSDLYHYRDLVRAIEDLLPARAA